MRSSRFALAAAIALALYAPQAFADEAEETSTELAEQPTAPEGSEEAAPAIDEEVGQAPAVAEEATAAPEVAEEATAAPEAEPKPESTGIELGPVGYDEEGHVGRIHVVVPGDTLWDISDAYLGTPWVWPSIWRENLEIANPHLIFPGDRIWITANEMRRVSKEEAERLLSGTPPEGDAVPAAMEDATAGEEAAPRLTYRYAGIETTGFVTLDEFEGATTIVDSDVPRVWLGDHDAVIIGRGEGEVEVGDQFEIFRPGARVFDPETGDVFGFAADQLGWLEIQEVHPETATGTIRLSRNEIQRGDHVLPRVRGEDDIEVGSKPSVEGRIVFTPNDRLNMGTSDLVFLDRGNSQGLEVGSPLEVYRPLGTATDEVQRRKVALPDDVVAKLLVVETQDDTAVAVVTYTTVELMRGDLFRGSDSLGWKSQ